MIWSSEVMVSGKTIPQKHRKTIRTHTNTHTQMWACEEDVQSERGRETQRSHTLLQLKQHLGFRWSLRTETGSTIFTEKLFLAPFCLFTGGSRSLATQRLWELQFWVNTKNNMLSIHVRAEPDRPVCGATLATDDRPQWHKLLEF